MKSDFLLGGDLRVNRMGFGAMRLGDWGGAGRTRETGTAVLRRAVELGVNHIDTAAFYPRANDLIRAALSPYAEDLVIATKVGPLPDDSGLPAYQATAGQLRAGGKRAAAARP